MQLLPKTTCQIEKKTAELDPQASDRKSTGESNPPLHNEEIAGIATHPHRHEEGGQRESQGMR